MSKEIDNAKIISEFQAGWQEVIKMIDSFVEKGYDAMSIYLTIVFADKVAKMLLKEVYPKANEEKFQMVSSVVDLAFEMYQEGLKHKKNE